MVLSNLSVIDFYNGKSVLITGGTGFIVKLIIEKLLRTCKDIDKIYLLVRENNTHTPEQRIQELVEKPVFECLIKSDPDSLKKLVPVCGDISLNNLGIRSEEERSFTDKVSVVIHSAASVKFNEPLDVSVNLNYEGTKRVLNLCHRMKNLESLVYISTAYTYPNQDVMKEIVYPPPTTDEKLKQFIKDKGMLDEKKLEQFLDNRPNTYTFTKALAESYVSKHHGNIPTAIVRPSITTASYMEPVPGFTDSWNGATPLLASITLGYKRVVLGKLDNVLDFVPADFVTNAVIIAGAKCHRTQNLEIYNVCTSVMNPLTIKNLYFTSRRYTVENRLYDVPFPFVILTNNDSVHDVLSFIFEKLPAILADSWLKMRGKKPRYVTIQEKAIEQQKFVKYFTKKTWQMNADNTAGLSRVLPPNEAKIFYCNPKDISWGIYIPNYCRGIFKYLLKK